MKNYIKLTEDNYFKALEMRLKPMDWIERQATKGSDVLNSNDRVITYDGDLLDFRRLYNVLPLGYREINHINELNKEFSVKLDFEKLLEDKDAIMSLDKVKELIRIEFLNVSNTIKLEDIDVKFHSYSDREYDFYVTLKRKSFKNNSTDEYIEYDENYRLKQNEVIQIVNNYLKEFKLKLKQNPSDGINPNAAHFSLRTNSNPETRDEVNFFYRFEELN